jgi:hypothetical protein
MKNELVDIIYQSLRRYSRDTSFIADVSLGSDHKSSEVIITLDDGEQKKDFVISNNDIREIE